MLLTFDEKVQVYKSYFWYSLFNVVLSLEHFSFGNTFDINWNTFDIELIIHPFRNKRKWIYKLYHKKRKKEKKTQLHCMPRSSAWSCACKNFILNSLPRIIVVYTVFNICKFHINWLVPYFLRFTWYKILSMYTCTHI